jgi:hypothetical protein
MFSSTATRDVECGTLSSKGKAWLKPRKESIQGEALMDLTTQSEFLGMPTNAFADPLFVPINDNS